MNDLATDFINLLMKHCGIETPSGAAGDFQLALAHACTTTLIEKLSVDGFKDLEEEDAFYRILMPLHIILSAFIQRKLKDRSGHTTLTTMHGASGQQPINWSGSKAELVELIYMLSHSGSINNGNAKTREIADCFERMFNIALGNFSKIFQEIRNRKKDTTSFASKMSTGLIRYIDRLDEDDLNSRFSKRA